MLNRSYFVRQIHHENEIEWDSVAYDELISKLYSKESAEKLCQALIAEDSLNAHIYSVVESRNPQNKGQYRVLADLDLLILGDKEQYKVDHPFIVIAEFLNLKHNPLHKQFGYWLVKEADTAEKSIIINHNGPSYRYSRAVRDDFETQFFTQWSAELSPISRMFSQILKNNCLKMTHYTSYQIQGNQDIDLLLKLYNLAKEHFQKDKYVLPAVSAQDLKLAKRPAIIDIYNADNSPLKFFQILDNGFHKEEINLDISQDHNQEIPFEKLVQSFAHKNCPQKISLILAQADFSNHEIELLKQAIQSGKLPKVIKINLQNSTISMENIVALIKASAYLPAAYKIEIDLSHHPFGREDIKMIARAFAGVDCFGRINLKLIDCNLTDDKAEEIIEAGKANLLPPHLNIDLSKNPKLSQQCVLAIKKAAKNAPSDNNNYFTITAESEKLHRPKNLSFAAARLCELALKDDDEEIMLFKPPYRPGYSN